jgi:hypothetical protein
MRKRAILASAALAAVTIIGGASSAVANDADPGPGANAEGTAVGSPGILSGDNIQIPVHIPVNVCGDSINVVGLLNPATGNACQND